jgi:(S)-ureidoglycine aminohydrolase
MQPLGITRSRVCKDHALLAPESFVTSVLPGWEKTQVIIAISPQMGAHFTQYLALMEPGATSGDPLPGIERMVYVLEGEVSLETTAREEHTLQKGGFAFLPPASRAVLRAHAASRLNVFEKRYVSHPATSMPNLHVGQEQVLAGESFLGDPDSNLKTLLPPDPAFDMAVNILSYKPGATLPLVEIHVMEHGLIMLEGQGVYRLGEEWYPVCAGDVIWMGPYCAQWFAATGKEPARYLYYKDVNRDPLELPG